MSGKPNPRVQQSEIRQQNYNKTWKIGLIEAPTKECPCCCVSAFCLCCASYANRKRTLYDDMSRYICCGGHCPCSGKMGEENCPELCLCLETVCCFAQSVASTRFMIQDEMHLENTQCDNCLVVRTAHCYLIISSCLQRLSLPSYYS